MSILSIKPSSASIGTFSYRDKGTGKRNFGKYERDKMKVVLNGKEEDFSQPLTICELLAAKNLEPDRVAVELNMEIIAKAAWTEVALQDEDKVESLSLVGGGRGNE